MLPVGIWATLVPRFRLRIRPKPRLENRKPLVQVRTVLNRPRRRRLKIVVETYGSGVGPLLGLVGTTDSRLNTITLVGDPSLINVAQSYLKQIDLRKRQVAVKVQILNIRLEEDATIDSSFSAKIGDTFIVSQSGKAHMNFGAYKPGAAAEGTGLYSRDAGEYQKPGVYERDVELVEKTRFFPPYVEAKHTLRTGSDDDGNPILTEVPLYDAQGALFTGQTQSTCGAGGKISD